jgi:hypothetical protein
MKVKELIKQLQECNQNAIVVMSSDGEGNNYSPLADIDTECNYKADTTYSGEVGLRELTPEYIEAGYGEDDILDGKPAVVLYPTN